MTDQAFSGTGSHMNYCSPCCGTPEGSTLKKEAFILVYSVSRPVIGEVWLQDFEAKLSLQSNMNSSSKIFLFIQPRIPAHGMEPPMLGMALST